MCSRVGSKSVPLSYSLCFLYFRASASCTHVSALLQALVGMTPVAFQLQPSGTPSLQTEEALPVTSFAFQWKPPRMRKQSSLPISEARFEKHVYGKERKRSLQPIEDFDPRPVEYRGTANQNLPTFLDKIRGEQLCVSLLLDPSFCHFEETVSEPSPGLPSEESLKGSISAFKASLSVTEDDVRKIEQTTRDQGIHFSGIRQGVSG